MSILFHELPSQCGNASRFIWRGQVWRKVDQTHALPVGADEPLAFVPSHDTVEMALDPIELTPEPDPESTDELIELTPDFTEIEE